MHIPFLKELIFLCLLPGCTTTQKVEVVSQSRLDELKEYSYKITSIQENDPGWQEVKGYIDRAMKGSGFYEDEEDPAIIVDVAYGTTEEMGMRSVTRAIEIKTPLGISSNGIVLPQRRTIYIEMNEPYILYTKRLEVSGHEPTVDTAPVFIIYVEIKSDKDNMREVLPILVAAALKNLDKTTDETIEIGLTDSDLIFIKSVDGTQ